MKQPPLRTLPGNRRSFPGFHKPLVQPEVLIAGNTAQCARRQILCFLELSPVAVSSSDLFLEMLLLFLTAFRPVISSVAWD